jgi:hypothetical protein
MDQTTDNANTSTNSSNSEESELPVTEFSLNSGTRNESGVDGDDDLNAPWVKYSILYGQED